jgi:hypothetical protein
MKKDSVGKGYSFLVYSKMLQKLYGLYEVPMEVNW